MIIKCKICHRETEADLKQKKNAYRSLCPECLFLAKQQNQPSGPEKMILRILHEHLIKQKVIAEKKFSVWKTMPDFRDEKCPDFWTESIFGNFLQHEYRVSYLFKGSVESAKKFAFSLNAAFDEKQEGSNFFEFDSKHLSFSVTDIFQIERDEKIPGLIQYCCVVEF